MKSLSFLLFLLILASASAFVPASHKRPTFVSSSSRINLCPEDAKDLEAVACIQYKNQHLMKEEISGVNNTYNDHHVVQHRNGPVAWCRRILYNLARKETLRP